ncbi:hypothetical protein ScPMuIL_012511 [Solemya velum]
MDALLRAVRKSPNVLGKSRHKKLPEDWAENKEAVQGGMTFYLKYLGSTLVEEIPDGESYGDGSSSKCVQTIVTMAKTIGKKLKKVSVNISPRGIKIINLVTKEMELEMSIYRICFCTADKTHDKVFAFIARNSINETMECHAYLCAKRKIAQAVTLTVSQAFALASECTCSGLLLVKNSESAVKYITIDIIYNKNNVRNSINLIELHVQRLFLSFPDSNIPKLKAPSIKSDNSRSWQSFDDENLDESFSKFAANRSREFPSFCTDLCQEDLDDSIQMYMNSQRCLEEFSRQKSVEDLLNL